MEELLKEDFTLIWNQECTYSFETLKKKLVEVPILKFLDWSKKFHVHIDASTIAVGEILTQPGEDNMDHPNAYASRKLNKHERNYSTIECEGLGMVFSL